MVKVLQVILGVIVIGLIVDFIGFLMWIASGQIPADNFYIGICTAQTLKAIFF